MKQKLIASTAFILLSTFAFSQKSIKGKIVSEANEPLANASVVVKNSKQGTTTNTLGEFSISLPALPATLVFSHTSFEPKELEVSTEQTVHVQLSEITLNPIVVAPNRFATKLTRSSTSIERYGAKDIAMSPNPDYYGPAFSKTGVDVTTSSLTFKTISTRGFNGSGSTRVNQLVDGMDNQAPGMNFFVGNFAGLTELDVDNIEILPGASSALYGPGGMNGTILINSKNPFKYQGLTVLVKEGINHIDKKQRPSVSPYHDFSFRWAKAFKNRFAFKVGAQYLSAKDWLAGDSTNYFRAGVIGKRIPGNRNTDPNYDGVNVYGDETSVDIYPFLAAITQNPNAPHIKVSRTGYAEKDMIDPETKNIKLSGAVHYKLTDKLEALLMGYWSTGNTVYTGNNRYVLKDIKIAQYKAELKHTNWFLRSYTTQEDGGEAYSATLTGQLLNEAWKRSYNPNNPAASWYPQYAGAYAQARYAMQLDDATSHNIARAFADQGRPVAGSPQFKQIFDQVRNTPIPNGGLFLEKSQLWMTEGQYNFENVLNFADIIVGANIKTYILDSKGTLFIDTAGAIKINETGAYAQVTKNLFDDYLQLSVSGRYDKNEDFKAHFTPRVTALIKIARDNNIRLSYQTAYRFPSTQQKYIRLNVGDYTILGGLPWVIPFMQAEKSPVYELDATGTPASTSYVYKEFKPENMRSYEVGYKGVIANKMLLDAYAYFGQYADFLGRNALYQPSTGNVYSTVVNSSTKVKTHGYGVSIDYRLKKNYSLLFNAFSDVITDVPSGFQSYFNTPKYRVNAGIANSGIGKTNIGFNILWRWQDAFMWDGELANGPVKAICTIDAQVNYKLPRIKSMIKLGGTNILNHYYKNAYGNPEIGGLYYVSFAFNIL